MKIKKQSKTFLITYILITFIIISHISCSLKEKINHIQPNDGSNVNTLSNPNMKKINSHNKYKLHNKKLYKFKENEKKDLNDDVEKSSTKTSDSPLLLVSWFVFIPLVLLIFVMTILSVAGFLILVLNSNSTGSNQCNRQSNNRTDNTRFTRQNTPGNRNVLTNSEILEILKYKQMMKKKMKNSNNSNYKPESEPESVACLKN
jgi:hypothetical protein